MPWCSRSDFNGPSLVPAAGEQLDESHRDPGERKLTKARRRVHRHVLSEQEEVGTKGVHAQEEARVTSPTTMAKVSSAPLSKAARMLGRITRKMMVDQPRPGSGLPRSACAHPLSHARIDRTIHIWKRQDHIPSNDQDIRAEFVVVSGCKMSVSVNGILTASCKCGSGQIPE